MASEICAETIIDSEAETADISASDQCHELGDIAIQTIIDRMVNQVIADENQVLPLSSLTESKAGDIGIPESDLAKSQSWGLGVSQTGRVMDPICLQQNIFSSIAAENLVEYQWPAGSSGDYYMLQEQVSTFLNITSFKRKYPEIERRKLDADEVNHLLSNHVISEVQVTLGLTALRSADVCDMMMKEYPEKYNEYCKVMQEREKQKMRNKYKEYVTANTGVEKSQMTNNLKKAMRQAAAYNSHLNRQRKEDFSAYYDMSTNVLQYPRQKVRKLDPSLTKPSLYPCALIPGQFQEYYQSYTKDELMYFPLNTALYGPPQPPPILPEGNFSDSGSDSVNNLTLANKRQHFLWIRLSQNKEERNYVATDVGVRPIAAESDTSALSLPRSIKSTTSNKQKRKSASAPSPVVGESVPMEVSVPVPPEETASEAGATKDQTSDLQKSPGKPVCGICSVDETRNKKGEPEELIKCSQCDNHGHPSCLEMSEELVSVMLTYDWQCMECKTCTICSMPHREDLMMFCDRCDRGYHTFCVSLRAIPSGVWACSRCTYADPEFIKRRRKQLRASQSPSGRTRGGKRRRPRNSDPRQTVIIDMEETNLSTSSDIESSKDSACNNGSEVKVANNNIDEDRASQESERKPLLAVIKASAENNGFEISLPSHDNKKTVTGATDKLPEDSL